MSRNFAAMALENDVLKAKLAVREADMRLTEDKATETAFMSGASGMDEEHIQALVALRLEMGKTALARRRLVDAERLFTAAMSRMHRMECNSHKFFKYQQQHVNALSKYEFLELKSFLHLMLYISSRKVQDLEERKSCKCPCKCKDDARVPL